MTTENIAGWQFSQFASCADPTQNNNSVNIQQWIRDTANFIDAADWWGKYHAAYYYRIIDGSATATITTESDSRFDSSLATTLGVLVDDVANTFISPKAVFLPIVFIRTFADFGEGYSQYNLQLDVENNISVTVDDVAQELYVTNNSGGTLDVVLLIMSFDPTLMTPSTLPVIS